MSPRFLPAVTFVLNHETEFQKGHYGDFAFAITENDPDDPGGKTKFGIDQRSHPDVDIAALTVDRARQIYFSHYWGPSHAEALPVGVGEVCFDSAVNCGVGRSAIWLQDALQHAGTYHGALDGAVGPLTLAAAAQSDPGMIVSGLLETRRSFYRRLAAASPPKGKYLRGWLARVDDLDGFAQSLLNRRSALPLKLTLLPSRWKRQNIIKPLRAAA